MSPIQSKFIRSAMTCRFPAVPAPSSTRACPRMLAWAALCLCALPGVSRADEVGVWTVTVPETWTSTSGDTGDGLRTVTGQLFVGYGDIGPGTLIQTGGTIDTSDALWGTIIAQGGGASGSAYSMSGNASFLGNGTDEWNQATLLGNEADATWILTDSANASLTTLLFGNGGNEYANHLLLSGSATFSATSLLFNNGFSYDEQDIATPITNSPGANQYISFATGSTATFTAGNMTFDDYFDLVTSGNIRVDGEAAVMNQFQVTGEGGHTLSLTAIPEPGSLLALGCLVGSGLCLRSRRR